MRHTVMGALLLAVAVVSTEAIRSDGPAEQAPAIAAPAPDLTLEPTVPGVVHRDLNPGNTAVPDIVPAIFLEQPTAPLDQGVLEEGAHGTKARGLAGPVSFTRLSPALRERRSTVDPLKYRMITAPMHWSHGLSGSERWVWVGNPDALRRIGPWRGRDVAGGA